MPATFISKTFAAAWAPPDRRPIYESLADEVIFGAESPYPGPLDIRNSPQIREPLDALMRDEVRTVSVSGAAQLAKTLLGLLFVIWIIKRRPGLTTWNGQTDDAIKKVSEDKAWPLFRRCRSLMELLPTNRHKERTKSIIFPHMSLRFQSASENNAHSDTVRYQINDERHLWPAGMIHKFLSRVGSMPDHKVLNLSTGSRFWDEPKPDGTIAKVGDDFFEDWNAGSRGVWSVRCPGCGVLQPLAWQHRDRDGRPLKDVRGKEIYGFAWDENETTRPNGKWNFGELKKTVRWKCAASSWSWWTAWGNATDRKSKIENRKSCAYELADTPGNIRLLNAVENGACYVHQNPLADPAHVSFRFPAMVSDLVGWGTLAVEWLKAQEALHAGNISPLKTFIQNRLGEPWDESFTFAAASNPTGDYSFGDEWLAPLAEGEPDATSRCKEFRRFFTVDVQAGGGQHFYGLCRQWSADGESRLAWFGRLESWAEVRAKQIELGVTDRRTFVDTGDEAGDCYTHIIKYGWTGLKGSGRPHFRHITGAKDRTGKQIIVLRPYSTMSYGDPGVGKRRPQIEIRNSKFENNGRARSIRTRAPFFVWSNLTIKDFLFRLRAGKGKYWGRPRNEDPEYTEQLHAEVKKQFGQESRYVKIRARNEATDLEAMQLVAAMMSGLIHCEVDSAEAAEATVTSDE